MVTNQEADCAADLLAAHLSHFHAVPANRSTSQSPGPPSQGRAQRAPLGKEEASGCSDKGSAAGGTGLRWAGSGPLSTHFCREVHLQGEAPPPQGRGSGRRSEGSYHTVHLPVWARRGQVSLAIDNGDGGPPS